MNQMLHENKTVHDSESNMPSFCCHYTSADFILEFLFLSQDKLYLLCVTLYYCYVSSQSYELRHDK